MLTEFLDLLSHSITVIFGHAMLSDIFLDLERLNIHYIIKEVYAFHICKYYR